ncbi:MAG: ABC transporter permease [Roseburia sp.]
MLGVMLQKLWHKKWMAFSLLLGITLLIATAVSFPMYRDAVYNRMLQDEFNQYLSENGEWPAENKMIVVAKKNAGGKAISKMETFTDGLFEELGVAGKENIRYYSLARADAHSLMNRDDVSKLEVRLGCLSGLAEHAQMISGTMYSDEGITEDGEIEVVISEAAMVNLKLLVGETIEFDSFRTVGGEKVRLKIVGIFREADSSDFYWQVSPENLENDCLMQEELFAAYFTGENAEKYTITCNYYSLFAYDSIEAADVNGMVNETKYLLEESAYRGTMSQPAYLGILEDFQAKQKRIDATLFMLQIPVLILLGAFLLMISGQMYEMERNEISVLKSRGASGGQIFRLYLYQSMFLAGIGCAAGLPLGSVFCRLLGSADNFLQFGLTRKLAARYTTEAVLYAAAAFLLCVIMITLPAIKHSRVTIVNLKQQKALKRKSWWEKCFLDLIFLGISFYGYYNYRSHTAELTERVLQGKALDPLLYISSSLFILGAGLFILRLVPVLVKGIFFLGKRWWSPASYASFMEIVKNGRKQQFIMLFLILTLSLGMFHATVARTIMENAVENESYLDGADLVLQEVWSTTASFASQTGQATEKQYIEPDFGKYSTLTGIESLTKVIRDDKSMIQVNEDTWYGGVLMGIHTREFGENTELSDALLSEPYHQLLNELAVMPDGVIVSKNLSTEYGMKKGDTIRFRNRDEKEAKGTIIGFVEYWPGFSPRGVGLNEEGEMRKWDNFLIVANYASLRQSFGVTPYEVWMTVKDGESTDFFYDWMKENDVSVKSYTDREKQLSKVQEDPLLQGTNGVLTMSFLVTILLCAAGYLIYWVMSIRQREMMFGVLRACGMHKGEIFHMLTIEQIFSGVLSVAAGFGIGKAASEMFTAMFQTAYAAADQVLPVRLVTNAGDLVQLYGVTAVVMVACLFILAVLVFKMNVAKALKLGEE